MSSTSSTTVSSRNAEIANWVCTALAMTVLLVRIGSIQYQLRRPDVSTYVAALSLTVLTARTICNYYILKYGTVGSLDPEESITQAEYNKAATGSVLALAARVLITSFYWLQCVLLLLVYRRILSDIRWVQITIRFCWVAIVTTWIAVVLTTFLECRPLNRYWQLTPDPGSCVRAYGQLLVQCISNISIDLILMAISIPLLRAQARVWPHNLQLGSIVILGTFCIIITSLRIVYTYQASSAQPARSLWASVQAVVSAFVANAPSIYGALIVLKRRKGTETGRSGLHADSDDSLTHIEEVAPTSYYEVQAHTRNIVSKRSGEVEVHEMVPSSKP